jgi:hypothetical protein
VGEKEGRLVTQSSGDRMEKPSPAKGGGFVYSKLREIEV